MQAVEQETSSGTEGVIIPLEWSTANETSRHRSALYPGPSRVSFLDLWRILRDMRFLPIAKLEVALLLLFESLQGSKRGNCLAQCAFICRRTGP